MILQRRDVLAGGTAAAALAAPSVRAEALVKVTISQALLIANYTPVYLAQQRGLSIATLRFPSNTNTTPKYLLAKLGGFDPATAGTTFMEFPPGAQAPAVKDGRADLAVVFAAAMR